MFNVGNGGECPLSPDQLSLGGWPVADFVQGVDIAEAKGAVSLFVLGAADVDDVAY